MVCTDDPAWVKRQAVFAGMAVSEGHSPGRDLALLAGCRDVVFGVGTFAWLGAYIATGGGVRPTGGKVPPSPSPAGLVEWLVKSRRHTGDARAGRLAVGAHGWITGSAGRMGAAGRRAPRGSRSTTGRRAA